MGFSPRTETLLERASGICDGRGARLTDLRRQVLGLILDSGQPTGAYDLLDRLKITRHGAAPPTVYRALDFLLENGLIHRLERLSAFVGCIAHDEGDHAAQFLICRSCGRVTEMEDHELAHALADAARRLGFVLGKATIEAEGQCAKCAPPGSSSGTAADAAPVAAPSGIASPNVAPPGIAPPGIAPPGIAPSDIDRSGIAPSGATPPASLGPSSTERMN